MPWNGNCLGSWSLAKFWFIMPVTSMPGTQFYPGIFHPGRMESQQCPVDLPGNEILLMCAVQNGSLRPQMAFWVLEMWLMSLRNWFLHFRSSLNSCMWALTTILDRAHLDSGWCWARSLFWIWMSSFVRWSHLRTLQLGTWCLKTGFPCWSLRPLGKNLMLFHQKCIFWNCITKYCWILALFFTEFFRLSLSLVSGERKARQIIISAHFSAWTVGEFFTSSWTSQLVTRN